MQPRYRFSVSILGNSADAWVWASKNIFRDDWYSITHHHTGEGGVYTLREEFFFLFKEDATVFALRFQSAQ